MNRVRYVSIDSLDRRAGLAVILIGVYGAIMGSLIFAVGYAGKPGWTPIAALQVLMLPVLFTTFYMTVREDQDVVPLIGIAPSIIVALFYIALSTVERGTPPGYEILGVMTLLGGVVLAFNGSWAIIGYAAGTAVRWRQQASTTKRRLVRSCLWVLLGSATVGGAYIGAIDLAVGWGVHV